MQSFVVQDVTGNEVDALEVPLLIEEQVVDADIMSRIDCFVGQPAADVTSAPHDQHACHRHPRPQLRITCTTIS